MKILFVTPGYYPHVGGVETHVQSIAERLVKRGYDVEVYATDPKGILPVIEVINGIKVRRFRSFAPNNAYYLPNIEMLKALKSTDADIVHAHNIQAFPLLYSCLAKGKYRLVLTTHMHTGASSKFRNMILPFYLRLIRKYINRADIIVSVSNYERDIIVSRLKVDPSRVIVIPNGINDDVLVVRHIDDGLNLLSVGRLEKFKNFDKVIEALHILHNRYGLKDARLTIVGNGQDKDRLVRLTNRLNINDKVVFKNNLSREELLQEYARAKLFILVSEYESFGIAAVEAIAMGIPTVVNNASALVEFVKSNAAVGIDPPITADKVADAIIKAMNFKPINVRDKLITWDEVANRIEKLYKELAIYYHANI